MMNPLLVGFLGVLGGGIIVAFCHAIIVFCNDHQRPTRNGTFLVTPREDVAVASAAARVDRPTVHVSIVTMFQTKEEVCVVCLGEFKESEGVRVLRDCSHVFHVSCIDKWLEIHPNCPLCRASAAVMVPLSDHGRASTEAEINGTREPAEVGGNVG